MEDWGLLKRNKTQQNIWKHILAIFTLWGYIYFVQVYIHFVFKLSLSNLAKAYGRALVEATGYFIWNFSTAKVKTVYRFYALKFIWPVRNHWCKTSAKQINIIHQNVPRFNLAVSDIHQEVWKWKRVSWLW